MTKIQIKNEVIAALESHKANAKLTKTIVELLEEYAARGSKGAEKRDKVIEADGSTYVWCNRHEVYEPSYNFKTDKSDCCKLAHIVWNNFGTRVKEAQEELDIQLDKEDMDIIAVKEAQVTLKDLKAQRGGRYNFEDNQAQFPDVESYNYDNSLHRLS